MQPRMKRPHAAKSLGDRQKKELRKCLEICEDNIVPIMVLVRYVGTIVGCTVGAAVEVVAVVVAVAAAPGGDGDSSGGCATN